MKIHCRRHHTWWENEDNKPGCLACVNEGDDIIHPNTWFYCWETEVEHLRRVIRDLAAEIDEANKGR